jgi:non-specific serine/threonine protein kinase
MADGTGVAVSPADERGTPGDATVSDSARWSRVKALFQAALDREPHERVAFLREACSHDEDLQAEVESLLAAHAQAGAFAERPAIASLDSMDGERWRRVKEICGGALDRTADDRIAMATVGCGDDHALRQEVEARLALEALLAQTSSSGKLLGATIGAVAAELLPDVKRGSLAGRQIGPYSVLSLLCAGGMGEVYRAHDTVLRRDVAIKVVPAWFTWNRERLARFEREAQVLASLNHRNIAQIYTFQTDEEVRAIVMELVEGPTLADRLTTGPVDVAEALNIARQLAAALHAAHERSIIHRDLKPANIKVTTDGTVKVLDFGLAKTFQPTGGLQAGTPPPDQFTTSAPTAVGVIVGTVGYMSPEQARGIVVDQRTDLWAFGVVLYEMFTGAPAFHGETPSDTLAAVLQSEPDWGKLPADIPVVVRTLLRRCLEKDPAKRLESAARARSLLGQAMRRRRAANLPGTSPHVRDVAAIWLNRTARTRTASQHALTGRLNNLPQQLTSFIGRDNELVAVTALLGKARLLTLTGSGGCGKTRLMLRLAEDVRDSYRQGVWLVELASLLDPALVVTAVATTLGISEQTGPLEHTLVEQLRRQQLLLLLDNCEHVLVACAQLSQALLQHCPGVHLLASSREALNIQGELTYRVPSLSVPDKGTLPSVDRVAQCDAVRLFTERARLCDPTFVVTAQNAVFVARICRHLGGIPLALELAAARLQALSVDTLAERVEHRLGLLTGGSRIALPRHQTLHATIDWSYGLLAEEERALFRRLSVFAGGWSLEAAEAVCVATPIGPNDVLDLLVKLVQKSLVLYDKTEQGRYALLDTVRQYAKERLVEAEDTMDVHERHLDYFVAVAEGAEPHLRGPEQVIWSARLEREHDNVRLALTWSAKHAPLRALCLAAALWRFWLDRGYFTEGREWLSRVLQGAELQPELRGSTPYTQAMVGGATLAHQQGDYKTASLLFDESLAIQRERHDKDGIALSLLGLGHVARDQGDYETARGRFEQCLVIHQASGNQRGVAGARNNLGVVAYEEGDFAAARSLHEASLTIRQQLGDKRGIAITLNGLGLIAHQEGDDAKARALWEEGRTIFQKLGDKSGLATSLASLGALACEHGDFEAGRSLCRESLAIRYELGDKWAVAGSLESFARVATLEGDWQRATRLWGAAAALREAIGVGLGARQRQAYERDIGSARAALDEAVFAATWAEGRAMTVGTAVRYATADRVDVESFANE